MSSILSPFQGKTIQDFYGNNKSRIIHYPEVLRGLKGVLKKSFHREAQCRNRACPCPNFMTDSHKGCPCENLLFSIRHHKKFFQQPLKLVAVF